MQRHSKHHFITVFTAIVILHSIGMGLRADNALKSENGQNGVLVLSDGTVLKGAIHRTQFGYLVKMPNGRRVVSASKVYLHTKSERAAYQVFSKRSSKINIPARLKLAHWCLQNHLLDEAGIELKNILVIEEDNREARSLLKKLEELLDPENPVHMAHSSATIKGTKLSDAKEVQFLGGLPKDLAKTFSSKVQPILLNQCGTNACHGSEKQKFNLHPGGKRVRQYADENYQSISKQINWNQPGNSPLLTMHQNLKGSRKDRGYFKGRSGAKQKELIHQWIVKVAKLKGDQPEADSLVENKLVQASAEISDKEMPLQAVPNSRKLRKVTEDPVLKKVLKSEQNDPFSADEFNRKFHDR